jgi:hypothetical protein
LELPVFVKNNAPKHHRASWHENNRLTDQRIAIILAVMANTSRTTTKTTRKRTTTAKPRKTAMKSARSTKRT